LAELTRAKFSQSTILDAPIERDVRIDDAIEVEAEGTTWQTPDSEGLAALCLSAVRETFNKPEVGNDESAVVLLPRIVVH
jgi:hypothetical protein